MPAVISKNVEQSDPYQKYDWLTKIGDGSFGEVHKARDQASGGLVAMKAVKVESEQELVEFVIEVDILAVCDHVNVIRLVDAFYWNSHLYMALEYCSGGALDCIFNELGKPLDEQQIRVALNQVLQGLHYLHTHHIIHRDLKAGNILLTGDGQVKLADFGVSAFNTKTAQLRSTFIGTPYWMAPEVIGCETSSENPYSEKCDIWSLGVTAIECAEMNPPLYDQHPMRVLFRIPKADPPVLAEPSKWSEAFSDFISLCLQMQPTARPSAKELWEHPFVKGEDRIDVMRDLLATYQSIKANPETAEKTSSEPLYANVNVPMLSETSIQSTSASSLPNHFQQVSLEEGDDCEKVQDDGEASQSCTLDKKGLEQNLNNSSQNLQTNQEEEIEEGKKAMDIRKQQVKLHKIMAREEASALRALESRQVAEREQLRRSVQSTREDSERKAQSEMEALVRQHAKEMERVKATQQSTWKAFLRVLEAEKKRDHRTYMEQQTRASKMTRKELKEAARDLGRAEMKTLLTEWEKGEKARTEETGQTWLEQREEGMRQLKAQQESRMIQHVARLESEHLAVQQALDASLLDAHWILEYTLQRMGHDMDYHHLHVRHDMQERQQQERHAKESELQRLRNRAREMEMMRSHAAQRKAFPKVQKLRTRELTKEHLRKRQAFALQLKAEHKRERDKPGLKASEKKQLKRKQEEEEKSALLKMDTVFNAEERARLNAENDQFVIRLANEVDEVNRTNLVELSELLEIHAEKEQDLREHHSTEIGHHLALCAWDRQALADLVAKEKSALQATHVKEREAHLHKYKDMDEQVRRRYGSSGNLASDLRKTLSLSSRPSVPLTSPTACSPSPTIASATTEPSQPV